MGGEPLRLFFFPHVAGERSAAGLPRRNYGPDPEVCEHAEGGAEGLGAEETGVASEEECDLALVGGTERHPGGGAPGVGKGMWGEVDERTQG